MSKFFILILQNLFVAYWCFSQQNNLARDASVIRNRVYKYARFEFDNDSMHMTFSDMEGFKLYTPKYFMYTILSKAYPVSFGLSGYTLSGNKMVQQFIYKSETLDTPAIYHVNIIMTDTGYIQKMKDFILNGQKVLFTEVFAEVPAVANSPLDGLWKNKKSLVVKAGDTLERKGVQYKMFTKGHYLYFTHHIADSSPTTWKKEIGYGLFKVSGNALHEKSLMSNKDKEGSELSFRISFEGKDTYTQVLADALNGTTQIETYERVN